MKSFIVLTLLLGTLSACSDRERVNCERTRNKAAVTGSLNQIGGGRCG